MSLRPSSAQDPTQNNATARDGHAGRALGSQRPGDSTSTSSTESILRYSPGHDGNRSARQQTSANSTTPHHTNGPSAQGRQPRFFDTDAPTNGHNTRPASSHPSGLPPQPTPSPADPHYIISDLAASPHPTPSDDSADPEDAPALHLVWRVSARETEVPDVRWFIQNSPQRGDLTAAIREAATLITIHPVRETDLQRARCVLWADTLTFFQSLEGEARGLPLCVLYVILYDALIALREADDEEWEDELEANRNEDEDGNAGEV